MHEGEKFSFKKNNCITNPQNTTMVHFIRYFMFIKCFDEFVKFADLNANK